jgi:hypothetical protein
MARSGIIDWFKRLMAQLGGSSLERGDYRAESRWRDQAENTDAWAQMYSDADFPPNYVPPADEGRPRH